MGKKICVIGSSNIDQFSYVNKFPQEGETIIGESFKTGFGGKGANQAVMAGILGSDVYLSLIHISEPTRPGHISYAVFCL